MLNCGATIDLAANLSLTPSLKCLVFDSHKPIHINNVHGSENSDENGSNQVFIVKDSSVSVETVPTELSESEEEEEASDDDEATRKRKREKWEAHEAKRRRLIEYNAFNYYSCPCSMLVGIRRACEAQVYWLARELDRCDNEVLWLSVVGVTDQYLRSHISDVFYASCYTELAAAVESLNLQGGSEDNMGTLGTLGTLGTIQQSFEPRFLLYRFWSLYESMVRSDFVVARFQLVHSRSGRVGVA